MNRKMNRTLAALAGLAAAALVSGAALAQPAGITLEMIERTLPEEGAPLAEVGPYDVLSNRTEGSDVNTFFRPEDLEAFPGEDTLPVVLWGNGGCAADPGRFSGFLHTLASYGYLVVTTADDGTGRRATAADLGAGLDWAFAENERADSPLAGKVDTGNVAVMGVSCGGVMALDNAADPRVTTVGVWNSGVSGEAMSVLSDLHGPTLYIDGGEVDFMYEAARANFEAIDDVPVFYGSRDNAGHSATYFHPNGGEFANVAADWLNWRLKGDEEASRRFVGADCELCTDSNWEVAKKGID